MLNEIYCDKFIQPIIKFDKGLNVILGSNSGDNSIGKSTMLLIIDYVFGGSTYSSLNDIKRYIKNHDIFLNLPLMMNLIGFVELSKIKIMFGNVMKNIIKLN